MLPCAFEEGKREVLDKERETSLGPAGAKREVLKKETLTNKQ